MSPLCAAWLVPVCLKVWLVLALVLPVELLSRVLAVRLVQKLSVFWKRRTRRGLLPNKPRQGVWPPRLLHNKSPPRHPQCRLLKSRPPNLSANSSASKLPWSVLVLAGLVVAQR